jgi:hypothetical protein
MNNQPFEKTQAYSKKAAVAVHTDLRSKALIYIDAR